MAQRSSPVALQLEPGLNLPSTLFVGEAVNVNLGELTLPEAVVVEQRTPGGLVSRAEVDFNVMGGKLIAQIVPSLVGVNSFEVDIVYPNRILHTVAVSYRVSIRGSSLVMLEGDNPFHEVYLRVGETLTLTPSAYFLGLGEPVQVDNIATATMSRGNSDAVASLHGLEVLGRSPGQTTVQVRLAGAVDEVRVNVTAPVE